MPPISLFIVLLFVLAAPVSATESALRRIDQREQLSATQLIVGLSAPAPHRVKTSGQRIDLFLAGVKVDPEQFPRLPESGAVIRTLLVRLPRELMISFVLRAPPKSVKVSTQAQPAAIWLDLAWDEEGEKILPGIAAPVGGIPRLGRDRESFRLTGGSPYGGNWRSFFLRHETPMAIPAPLRFTLPGLPRLAATPDAPPFQELPGTAANDWGGALPRLREELEKAAPGRAVEMALLRYAEALARTGALSDAGAALSRFLTEFPNASQRARARYLLAWVRAEEGESYQARYQLGRLPEDAGSPQYHGLARLLQGEIDLALGRPTPALQAFDQLPATGELASWRAIRRGDALADLGRSRDALRSYRQAQVPPRFWREHPFSLLRQARALESVDAATAAERYREAAPLLTGEGAPLVRFAEAHCSLRAGAAERALEQLLDLVRLYPETEGGVRARMKLADLAIGEGIEVPQDPMSVFDEAARRAPSRALREEASLKRAILHALAGESGKAIEQLRSFLREFGGGALRREAEALLVELLPRRVGELIAGGEEIAALVLVEQHRELLLSGKMHPDFLFHLGEVFERIGLLDRAARVYGFIADGFIGRPEAARAYLPLTRIRLQRHDFTGAAEAARSYLERFPAGADRNEIFALLLESLAATGRLEEAAKLLTSPRRLTDPRIETLAGRIFWRLGELERAQAALAGAAGEGGEPTFPQALRAEALYRQGRGDQALPLYQELAAGGPFADQALFRCAQIRLAQGEGEAALNLLRRLAEKGGEGPWQKAGAEFLQIQQVREATR